MDLTRGVAEKENGGSIVDASFSRLKAGYNLTQVHFQIPSVQIDLCGRVQDQSAYKSRRKLDVELERERLNFMQFARKHTQLSLAV